MQNKRIWPDTPHEKDYEIALMGEHVLNGRKTKQSERFLQMTLLPTEGEAVSEWTSNCTTPVHMNGS